MVRSHERGAWRRVLARGRVLARVCWVERNTAACVTSEWRGAVAVEVDVVGDEDKEDPFQRVSESIKASEAKFGACSP